MFQNKHIIRFSFIGLFLAILASILFYRYFTLKNIVLDSLEKENSKINKHFTREVWNKYENATLVIKHKDLNLAINNKEFIEFSQKIVDYFTPQKSVKVSILNATGKEFITTKDRMLKKIQLTHVDEYLNDLDRNFFHNLSYDDSIKMSLKGNIVSNIILDSNIDDSNSRRYFIEIFYPINDSTYDEFYIDGIIYSLYDITEEWNKIRYFEKRVSMFLIVVFALFFVVVLFNTHHAQRIIDQQVANNKFLEEEKQKAESESNAKTQFLANVSHELRTPLNAIIGFSEVILTETYGKLQPDQYKEYILDINNSGKHLLSVINDILDFSKASSDRLSVENIEVDASKLLSSSIRYVKPRADQAKVELIQKTPKEHVVIKADPKRLKQAILNLLSNAVKFTPENGSVTLELEKNVAEQKVYIKVIDTGIGMEEKDIPKALSSFGQIDSSISRKYEGTGLGLPLTKKLVELMDGKFEITSKPGYGTTVIITFKYEDI
jgi:two-component system, cell cycle sensor histidine kinase PleC